MTLLTLLVNDLIPFKFLHLGFLNNQSSQSWIHILKCFQLHKQPLYSFNVPLILWALEQALHVFYLIQLKSPYSWLNLFVCLLHNFLLNLFNVLLDLAIKFLPLVIALLLISSIFVLIKEIVEGEVELLVEPPDLLKEFIERVLVLFADIRLPDLKSVLQLEEIV